MDERHASDEDVLSVSDGEQSASRDRRICVHLSHCWQFRTRSHELQRAMHAFVKACRQQDSALAARDGSRSFLHARVRGLVVNPDRSGKQILQRWFEGMRT